MRLAIENGKVTGYYCSTHNTYNDILNIDCKYCKSCNGLNENSQLLEYSYFVRLLRTGEFVDMTSSEMIELHSRFFNQERLLIRDMDDASMNQRREELRKIAYEAKARLNAIDQEDRERNAKRSAKQKEWLMNSSPGDPNISDAINIVKERKARQSKGDKMLATLTALGVANADSIVAAAIAKASGQAITTAPTTERAPIKPREKEQTASAFCLDNQHHNCTGSFILGGETHAKACDCKCHKPKVKVDLSSLKFTKK